MRTKWWIGVCLPLVVAVAAIAWWATEFNRPDARAGESPAIERSGNCCLWRVHKEAPGKREDLSGRPYKCPTGETTYFQTTFRLQLSSAGKPCDENPKLIPDKSTLEATGGTSRRKDGFAYFVGKFTIKDPRGTVLFTGTMEAIDRLGTHHAPFGKEACDQRNHLEGWLAGMGGEGATRGLLLRASLVAGIDPAGSGNSALGPSSLDGVVMSCTK